MSSITKNGIICTVLMFTISFLSGTAFCADTLSAAIIRKGRKIQHDGFLMEWGSQKNQAWDNEGVWLWSAVITPEGYAGYFCSKEVLPCSSWIFSMKTSKNKSIGEISFPFDPVIRSTIFAVDYQEFETTGLMAVEWLLPFVNSSYGETLLLQGKSRCGDTLPVLALNYPSPHQKKNNKLNIVLKAVVVGLLGVMYLVFQRKIRCLTGQKESLRR